VEAVSLLPRRLEQIGMLDEMKRIATLLLQDAHTGEEQRRSAEYVEQRDT